jgi:hypothetical protein
MGRNNDLNQGGSRHRRFTRKPTFRRRLKQGLWRLALLLLMVAAASLALVFLRSFYDYSPKYHEPNNLQREAYAGKP